MNDVIVQFWWDQWHLKALKRGLAKKGAQIARANLSTHLKSILGALLKIRTLKISIVHHYYIKKFDFLIKNQDRLEIASMEMIFMVTALYLAINESVPKLTIQKMSL